MRRWGGEGEEKRGKGTEEDGVERRKGKGWDGEREERELHKRKGSCREKRMGGDR